MAKYDKLAEYVGQQNLQTFDMPFHKIESLIGEKLPASAKRPQYWANTAAATNPVRAALKDTPYESFLVSGSSRVEFRRRF